MISDVCKGKVAPPSTGYPAFESLKKNRRVKWGVSFLFVRRVIAV